MAEVAWVNLLALQRLIDDYASLGDVRRGNEVMMRCHTGKVGEELHLFPQQLVCGWCMSESLLEDVLDE